MLLLRIGFSVKCFEMIRTALILLVFIACRLPAGDVSGEIRMPSTCSPEVSPAVIWLVPQDPTAADEAKKQALSQDLKNTALMQQSALQFVPRVLVLKKGQPIRFTNEDSEFHNVNVQARGELFNQTMPPGQLADFLPATTGILRIFLQYPSAHAGLCGDRGDTLDYRYRSQRAISAEECTSRSLRPVCLA
jgi:plastocyanin